MSMLNKRKVLVTGGEGTDHRQTRMLVEQGVAHNQTTSAPSLLMAGLWVKGDGDKVTLRNVTSHLPDFPADSLSPLKLTDPVILWNLRYQFSQTMYISYAPLFGSEEFLGNRTCPQEGISS